MIQIKDICKTYLSGDNEVKALKGVNINLRNSEFVSVLGPSGCGKTTLLNIVGGLDKYTSGDLVVNGVSTKEFKDRDWDTYRNHSVGFVFQSYNLIPHQTVLQNVEIALTLSGVSKSERRERAIKALEDVGLSDQIHKKPNAMSGGQMQRVAIARALVNNPDIILADEPTGALDTVTSVQVMEILKKVSKDRLVVMVTHNSELAEQYSTRIIRMLDGNVIDDSKPYTDVNFNKTQKKELAEKEKEDVLLDEKTKKKREKKSRMSFWTAFKLSLKNLFTKKGRTLLTSFAGSIGIIGIALILAVSQGMTTYINHVQESTLASYPITLEAKTVDLSSLITSFMNVGNGELKHDRDAVYKDPVIAELVNALSQVQENENDLATFKSYLESQMLEEGSKLNSTVTGIQYDYDLELSIYTKNIEGVIVESNTSTLMSEMIAEFMAKKATQENGPTKSSSSMPSSSIMPSMMMSVDLWQEILPGLDDNDVINDLIYEQYELIDGGSWPNEYDEIVLVVNENNELDDLTLYALGLIADADKDSIIDAAVNGEPLENLNNKWTYDEIKERRYKTILSSSWYQYNENTNLYVDVSELASDFYNPIEGLYDTSSIELKITGIIRPKKDSDASLLSSGIGYTSLLTKHIINESINSQVVQAQLNSPTRNVITGEPFKTNTGILSNEQKTLDFKSYISTLSVEEKAGVFISIKCLDIDPNKLQEKYIPIWMPISTDISAQKQLVADVLAKEIEQDKEIIELYLDSMGEDNITKLAQGICYGKAQELVIQDITNELGAYSPEQLSNMLEEHLLTVTPEKCAVYYDNIIEFSADTYEEVLISLGCLDLDAPSAINLYVASFEDKDVIIEAINDYNAGVDEEYKISYTDYLGIMMSSITTIINAITYVLIAFVSISLIVSSIMIGVIILISVQERTKEIGILRAIGASKSNVSSMFNAETIIIGFSSGLLGVLVTYLLCIPINLILKALTGLANLKAILPLPAAIILIIISMGLTLFSGLIPSRSASKKDPVNCLRSE